MDKVFRTGDPIDTVWRVGVAVAAGLAVLVLNLFAAVGHEYEARLARDAARAPVFLAEDASDMSGVLGYWGARDDSLDGEPVSVALLLPRGDPAATPPGVPRWPRAAEVFASPALVSAAGSDELTERYGSVVGQIDPSTLADSGEKVMYVGVDPDVLEEPSYWVPVVGFGVDRDPTRGDDGYFGSATYQSGRSSALLLLVVFVLAPLLVLLVVLARVGGERRDATVALLVALGASKAQLRAALWRAVCVPLGSGVLGAVALAAVLARVPWSVPYTGYVVSPSPDLHQFTLLLGCAVAGTWLTWAVLWASTRPRRSVFLSVRPVSGERRVSARPVVLLLGVLAVVNWLYALVNPTNPTAGAAVLFVGVLGCVVLIGPVTASVLAAIAAGISAFARRGSRPVSLLVGRELGSMARPAVRATIFMGVVALTATFATVLASAPGDFMRQVTAAGAANAGRSVAFTTADDARWLPALSENLPEGLHVVGIGTNPMAGASELTATCGTQVALLGRCAGAAGGRLETVVGTEVPLVLRVWGLDADTEVRTGEPSPGEVLVISGDDSVVDKVELARAMRPLVSPQPMIVEPEQMWVGGASVAVRQAGWIVVLGAIAGLFAVMMGCSSIIAEMVRMRRRHRVFSVYAGGFSRHLGLGLGLTGMPLVLGAVIGGTTAFAATWNAIQYGSASTTSVLPLLGRLLVVTCWAAAVVSFGAAWATSRRALGSRITG